MKHSNLHLIWPILAISVWLGIEPTLAQQLESYARLDSTQAYWKLKATYTDQKPVVQFFNNHNDLLYEERLPGYSNRITKRTVKAFDILLANLTSNRVLATTYLSNSDLLGPVSAAPAFPREDKESLKQVRFRKEVAVFSVEPSINQAGKLRICLAQLNSRPISIALEDEERKLAYYEEFTNALIYKRDVNLEQLPGGSYYLRVEAAQTIFSYRVTVDRIMNRYYLEAH